MPIDRTILAIDPGSTSLGWCILRPNSQVSSGFIKPKAKDSIGVRLSDIRTEMWRVCNNLLFGHDDKFLVVIEGGISNRQAFSSGAVVDYVRGMLLEFCQAFFKGDQTVRFIAPMSWKASGFLKPYGVRLGKGEKPTVDQLVLTGLNVCREHIYCQDQIDAGFMAVYARDNFDRLMAEPAKKTSRRKKK